VQEFLHSAHSFSTYSGQTKGCKSGCRPRVQVSGQTKGQVRMQAKGASQDADQACKSAGYCQLSELTTSRKVRPSTLASCFGGVSKGGFGLEKSLGGLSERIRREEIWDFVR